MDVGGGYDERPEKIWFNPRGNKFHTNHKTTVRRVGCATVLQCEEINRFNKQCAGRPPSTNEIHYGSNEATSGSRSVCSRTRMFVNVGATRKSCGSLGPRRPFVITSHPFTPLTALNVYEEHENDRALQ